MPDLTRVSEIVGCQLVAGPNNSVRLTEGYFFNRVGRRMRSDGDATATVSGTAAIGWLHAYGVESSNNVAGLLLSPDAPVLYRGTARSKGAGATAANESVRYLGSGRVETVGKLRAGRHAQALSKGNLIQLDVGSSGFIQPPLLGALGVTILQAPPQTTYALANFVPPTATHVDLQISNLSPLTTYVGRPGMITQANPLLSASNRYCAILPNNNLRFMMPLDADQSIVVLASTTGLLGGVVSLSVGSVQIEVMGYLFDR
ncbi:hypothetical protein [Xanthomonas campestris]|uniref:hypothetical protein n=1 Tax=Xanthomonas campestris TaxID=339 RepID=UPI000AF83483|nr:hypothetical protein [Xanthomonas campestris]